jgi:probable AcnD-accessory protein PrpF
MTEVQKTVRQKQIAVRAMYMRGGTSKGVFFVREDLPAGVREDSAARDRFMLRVVGSPDRYGKHIDGMGAATSSTSKVVVINQSNRPDCDVDYLFGAVGIEEAVVDWTGNCGNLSSAVGPFSITRGLVAAPRDGMATVRIWQANIGKRIVAHVPMQDGEVAELGDFELDGVAFPSAEVQLEFLDPGADEEAGRGGMFPTGNTVDMLSVPDVGPVEATLINAGNPTVFVDAVAMGLTGTEHQAGINADAALLAKMEKIRAHATVVMGLAATPQEATEKRPHTPKISFVARPAAYVDSSGKPVKAEDTDLLARIVSMGKLHHAMTGTGAVAIAVASAIPGTLVHRVLAAAKGGARTDGNVRFGHPSGTLRVGAEAIERGGEWNVTKVVMSRSARRLMDGQVFVPVEVLAG